jgi:Fe-S-cluster containining protein
VPIFYECQRCTACCRWPGQVRLTEAEIVRIAAHLGLSDADFIAGHTRLRSDRQGLSLLEKPNGECEFLAGNDCAIQPVKPQQCRDFPNLWNFPGFEKICHAIPRDVASEEFRRRIRVATEFSQSAASHSNKVE